MSPTVFRIDGMRFFFFSREETRRHVHVSAAGGEAKVWLDPRIEIARSSGFSERQLRRILRLVHEHEDEIRTAWHAHFGA